MPALWSQPETGPDRPPEVVPVLGRRVRVAIVVVAAGLLAVFAAATWVDPYGPDGRPLAMGTHKQLGLPECNFVRLTGLPCPSCGMTTSFALLMHGEVLASLRANAVGTLLAVCLLAAIPWSLIGAVRGRWLGVRALEPLLLRAVIVFTGLAVLRWGVLLATRAWGTG